MSSRISVSVGIDPSNAIEGAKQAVNALHSVEQAARKVTEAGNMADIKKNVRTQIELRTEILKSSRLGGYSPEKERAEPPRKPEPGEPAKTPQPDLWTETIKDSRLGGYSPEKERAEPPRKPEPGEPAKTPQPDLWTETIKDSRLGGYSPEKERAEPPRKPEPGEPAKTPQPDLWTETIKDSRLGGYSPEKERAEPPRKPEPGEPAKTPQRDLRTETIKDSRLGGYSPEIQLDASPLIDTMKAIQELMEKSIKEGNSGDTRQYASLISDIQRQLTFESNYIGKQQEYEKQEEKPKKFADTNFRALANAVYSSNDDFEKALQTDDLESVKRNAQLTLNSRNQYIKKAQADGFSEIKLDSKPMESGMKSLEAAIDRMVAEGRLEEAKEYGSILKDFQKQFNNERDKEKDKDTVPGQSRLIRGLNRFFGQGQNIIGQAGSGNVAGAALGAAGGIGELIKVIPKGGLIGTAVVGGLAALAAGANKLSEQWEKVMQPSMGLAASLGRLGDDADKNHLAFQEVFAQATDRKVLHGYKLEEGLALANQLSKMGAANVIGGEEQVFRYQRDTDADRNVLANAVGLAQRYRGGENVLGYSFGGLKQSGMEPGQYQEYLNATLRIFEEGLSRGVVKGFGEITRTQNMLAQIGETWKGEQGAEKYERMNNAVTGASALENDYDTIMYKAAMNLVEKPGDYIEVSKRLDKGLDTDILQEIHKIVEQTTGKDDTSAVIQYMEMFNLNATAAEELLIFLKAGDWSKAMEKIEDPASKGAQSPEMKLLEATEEIRGNIAKWGSDITPLKSSIVDGFSKLTNIIGGDKMFEYYKTSNMEVLQSLGLAGDELDRVNRLFEKAYTKKNQPDANKNILGDWGESAGKMQADTMANLPIDVKYQIASNPRLQRMLFSQLQRVEDFTPENVAAFEKALNDITRVDIEPASAKRLGLGDAFSEAIDRGEPAAMDFARMVKGGWNGRLPQYHESDEYRFALEQFSKLGADGLSSEEILGVANEAIRNNAQWRSTTEETDKTERIAPLGIYNILREQCSFNADTVRSREYQDFFSILDANHPEITGELLRKISDPHMKGGSDEGAYLSRGELGQMVQALREMIPALKEASTLIVDLKDDG